jgi:lysophospholipase L1-like esterase
MYSDTTVSLLERLDKNVNNLKIRKLFLLIGYNDLQYRSNAEIVANMSMILDRISAEKVFLQSILPVEAKSKDTNLRINDLNEDLKRLCTAKGVAYLDLNRHFLDEAGGLSAKYSIDGRHLSGSGYRLWKELIKENL